MRQLSESMIKLTKTLLNLHEIQSFQMHLAETLIWPQKIQKVIVMQHLFLLRHIVETKQRWNSGWCIRMIERSKIMKIEKKCLILDLLTSKQCKKLSLLPKAGMIIWKDDEDSKSLDYHNFWMKHKSAAAIAEAIKLYPIDFMIEKVNFMGNSLNGKDVDVIL